MYRIILINKLEIIIIKKIGLILHLQEMQKLLDENSRRGRNYWRTLLNRSSKKFVENFQEWIVKPSSFVIFFIIC